MSLEETITKLTAAVESLTEAFIAHTNDAKPAKSDTADIPKHIAEKAKPTPAKKPVVKAGQVDEILAAEEAATDAPAIPYSDIQALIKANVATKRDVITGLLTQYKVKMATELKPEQYKQFFDELTTQLGGESDLA